MRYPGILAVSLLLVLPASTHAESITVDQAIQPGACGIGVRGTERLLICRDKDGKLQIEGPVVDGPAQTTAANQDLGTSAKEPPSEPSQSSAATSAGTSGPAGQSVAGPSNPVVPDGKLGEFRHGTYPSPGIGDGNWTHPGVDIDASCGSPVFAFADGKVTDLIPGAQDKQFGALGYMVLIAHADALLGRPYYTLYLHLQEPPLVKVGDSVKGGTTQIGKVGATGKATGCHTHFEVRYFPERLFPAWENIYGRGDQRDAGAFKENWADPVSLFANRTAATGDGPSKNDGQGSGSTGEQLTGEQIRQLLVGNTVVQNVPSESGNQRLFQYNYPTGEIGYGKENGEIGYLKDASWQIVADSWCLKGPKGDICYSIARLGDRYRFVSETPGLPDRDFEVLAGNPKGIRGAPVAQQQTTTLTDGINSVAGSTKNDIRGLRLGMSRDDAYGIVGAMHCDKLAFETDPAMKRTFGVPEIICEKEGGNDVLNVDFTNKKRVYVVGMKQVVKMSFDEMEQSVRDAYGLGRPNFTDTANGRISRWQLPSGAILQLSKKSPDSGSEGWSQFAASMHGPVGYNLILQDNQIAKEDNSVSAKPNF